jgi:anthranilate phosphoribosyltransferase
MPKKQIVGVFNLELARIYNYLLQKSDKKYSIIYSLDGYDEISLTNDTKIYSNRFEKNYSSKEFGLENIKPDEIKGGFDIPSSSKIFMNILNGYGTQNQNNVVCANAGVAISTSKNMSISEGFEAAKESLESGKALKSFNKLKGIMK